MIYLKSGDVAAIAICASLWGVLNSIFSPIFFNMFGLPFLCDLIGFTALTITVWWTRKLGSATMVGAIATVINFTFNPSAVHFLGFTAASVIFDATSWLVGYDRIFRRTVSIVVSMIPISTLSAAIAGFLIGNFFMVAPALAKWGGVFGWAGIHAVGGIIGGVIGIIVVKALISRGIQTQMVRTAQVAKQAHAPE